MSRRRASLSAVTTLTRVNMADHVAKLGPADREGVALVAQAPLSGTALAWWTD